jgi:ATP-dependent Clp protease ATP-binding subunit ClpC
MVMERVKDFLSPELLNRIDHKVVFNPLTHNELEHIFKKLYTSFSAQWKANPKAIVPMYDSESISSKVKELYNPQFGARPIEQFIFNELEDEVIASLLTQA